MSHFTSASMKMYTTAPSLRVRMGVPNSGASQPLGTPLWGYCGQREFWIIQGSGKSGLSEVLCEIAKYVSCTVA